MWRDGPPCGVQTPHLGLRDDVRLLTGGVAIALGRVTTQTESSIGVRRHGAGHRTAVPQREGLAVCAPSVLAGKRLVVAVIDMTTHARQRLKARRVRPTRIGCLVPVRVIKHVMVLAGIVDHPVQRRVANGALNPAFRRAAHRLMHVTMALIAGATRVCLVVPVRQGDPEVVRPHRDVAAQTDHLGGRWNRHICTRPGGRGAVPRPWAARTRVGVIGHVAAEAELADLRGRRSSVPGISRVARIEVLPEVIADVRGVVAAGAVRVMALITWQRRTR